MNKEELMNRQTLEYGLNLISLTGSDGNSGVAKQIVESHLSALDHIEKIEAENKQMRELLFDIVENQQEFLNGDYLCLICGTELVDYHTSDCPIPKIEAILEEFKNE